MCFTWGLYLVVFLVPMISTIFAEAVDDLEKKKFLDPNTLKVVLCLTPVLFLFLPNTASDLSQNDEYRQFAFRLTIQISIDLFDAVEMLDVVLDETKNSHGIPKWFGRLMVAVAFFSFLLSLLQMAEKKTRRRRGHMVQFPVLSLQCLLQKSGNTEARQQKEEKGEAQTRCHFP